MLRRPTVHGRTRSASQLFDPALSWTAESVAGTTWGPVAQYAQSAIIKALTRIVVGKIVIKYKATEHVFGNTFDKTVISAKLVVRKEIFWTRLLLSTDLGFAESYMFGDFECDDMPTLLRIIAMNRRHLVVESTLTELITAPSALLVDNLSTKRPDLPTNFDLWDTFFFAFLSEDMNSSSGIFLNPMEDLTIDYPLESLEDAQLRKMMHVILKAKLKRGHRVLEIGSAGGAWSILAACTTGCLIDTIALNAHQHSLASERIEKAGLSANIKVHLMDLRDCMNIRAWEHSFDRFICIGVLETFGRDSIIDFWKLADWALTSKSGVGVVLTTTVEDAQYDKKGGEFIQKWLFPGSYVHSYPNIVATMNTTSEGRFVTDSVSNIGPHSARTFREWRRRFLRSYDYTIIPILKDESRMDLVELAWFKRKWIYFFDYCEAGFVTRNLATHIITFTRDGNESFGCDFDPVPIPMPNKD